MSNPQMSDCSCCAGIDTETPVRIDNPPGLPAIQYRVGDYTQFRESFVARLSSSNLPALSHLTTREESDFTIALCESAATMLDVLTFYQERIANENYLRTATERGSILELARLIGYTPLPGVAASTHLAFTLQESPGAPAQAAEPVTIPIGTRVQSVPGQGEQAQTFETVEAIEARVTWNAIPVQTTTPWVPPSGDTDLWLEGLTNPIQVGDVVLIVGVERLDNPESEHWDVRLLTEVEVERDNGRTRIAWINPLENKILPIDSPEPGVQVFVFRQRAALFGHNAPDPKLMLSPDRPDLNGLYDKINQEWAGYKIQGNLIDLDAAYPKIIPGTWFILVGRDTMSPTDSVMLEDASLFQAVEVSFPSRTAFGLSGKITHIIPDGNINTNKFKIQNTLVLAQSELLPTTQSPLFFPLYEEHVALASLHPELTAGRTLAVYGKQQRIMILPGSEKVLLELDHGDTRKLKEGDSLILLAKPAPIQNTNDTLAPEQLGAAIAKLSSELTLSVQDRDGKIGTLKNIPAHRLCFEKSHKNDPEVSEVVVIDSTLPPDRDRSTLKLKNPLRYCYERASVHLNANVTQATHGETVNEILGSGDARLRNSSFALKQSPLTYVSANTPSGRQSTLDVRVNDLRWHEMPTLYQRGPHERIYSTLTDSEAHTTIRFGDGVEGGRLPSGDHNVRATYRKGLGLAGNVAAGKLSTLLTRPLGVSGVSNPESASGGADGEKLEDARANAPLTVKTLDRAVSIQDYYDFTRAFAGIAKVHALLINFGPGRGVFLTVAGENGSPLSDSKVSDLFMALRDHGDPLIPIRIVDYQRRTFHLRASIKVAADADETIVRPKVEAALREVFGFEHREFGQGVTVDQLLAVMQDVTGVEASYLHEFYRTDVPPPAKATNVLDRLIAALPSSSYEKIPLGAELLTLDPGPLTLELMT